MVLQNHNLTFDNNSFKNLQLDLYFYFYEQAKHSRGPPTNFTFSLLFSNTNSLLVVLKNILEVEE
jgi:hypothetical protein